MIATLPRRAPAFVWLLALCCLLGLGAGQASAQGVVVDRDIVYYNGPEFYAPRHILDVYRLNDGQVRPVLMFIHGGAWTAGNKSQFGFLGNFFARRGYVTVVANYRLTDNSPGRVMHPGHIRDVARAFAWTHANIADYGGDPEKIFISGHSAGGHLVSLLAVDPRYLAEQGLSTAHIAGVLSISGVYDVRGIANVFGNPDQQRDASPRFHVGNGQPPPFLVLYAENDLGGLGAQAQTFAALLAALPAEVYLWEAPDRDHGSIVFRIPTPRDRVAKRMLAFMEVH